MGTAKLHSMAAISSQERKRVVGYVFFILLSPLFVFGGKDPAARAPAAAPFAFPILRVRAIYIRYTTSIRGHGGFVKLNN